MQQKQQPQATQDGVGQIKKVAQGLAKRLRAAGVEVTHTKILEALAGEAGFACYRALAAARPQPQAAASDASTPQDIERITAFVDRVADMYVWDEDGGEMDDNGMQTQPQEGYADSHEVLMELIDHARKLRPETMIKSRPYVGYDPERADQGSPCFWNAQDEQWVWLDQATRYTAESVDDGCVTNEDIPDGAQLLNVGTMKLYAVLLVHPDEKKCLTYHYFAEDEEHAKEQALDAEPEARVLTAARIEFDTYQIRLKAVTEAGWKIESTGFWKINSTSTWNSDPGYIGGWYALIPGQDEFFDNLDEHEADPENVPHQQNYLGFFLSASEAVDEVFQDYLVAGEDPSR